VEGAAYVVPELVPGAAGVAVAVAERDEVAVELVRTPAYPHRRRPRAGEYRHLGSGRS
jgi:hypothetical protein